MADKEEEKIEWNEEILVPLDGLDLGDSKKEDSDYDNGDLVPLEGWDKPKIDPEEYRKLKEERDRLLREKEKLEEWKKQREKEKSSSKSGEVSKPKAEHESSTGGLGKSLIIALLLAFGIVSYKMYDKKNADLQAQLADKDKQIETLKKQEPTAQPAEPKVIVKTEYVKVKDLETEQELATAKKKIASLENKPKSRSTRRQPVPAQQIAAARQAAARQYKVGDIITFGSYPFYEDGTKKAIDWKILDIDADNNALVISDYALDNVSYNKEWVDITWEDSSIRKWLNNEFLNKAFSPEQRRKIISSRITNKDNADYNTRGGNATNDKLFLLSIEEADKYFNSDESRIAYPTPYAKSKKSVNGNLLVSSSYVSTDRGGSCWWWLRSPGGNQPYAAYVDYGGFVDADGPYVVLESGGVRAALKINLNNL